MQFPRGFHRGISMEFRFLPAGITLLVAASVLTTCTEPPTAVREAPGGPLNTATDYPLLVGAGDIASCNSDGDEITADLLDGIPGTVFTTGDNAYQNGTAAEFQNCYGPSWGRHLARTRPSPGNHDYFTTGATPYFNYFGSWAGPSGKGYYSYDLGTWHLIALNSNIAADDGSPQAAWLRADLAAHPTVCALAYWHHPVFSSGDHGNNTKMKAIWKILDAKGVDIVVSGHDHDYERFAPQHAGGVASTDGIREFVVGTGGESLRPFKQTRPNSVVRISETYGVLKLRLKPTSYVWKFVQEPGASFSDYGSATCTES